MLVLATVEEQPVLLLLILDVGVESGDGAEMKAESEESEPVEDSADSFSKLQASEQNRRPLQIVTSWPSSAFWQRLQQKQEALACQ